MRRPVIVGVDDGTEQLSVWHWAGTDAHGPLHVEQVPVPPDDQLTRDLDAVTGHTKYTATVPGFAEAAARLRSHFRLDERPSLDDVLAHGRARFGLDEGNES